MIQTEHEFTLPVGYQDESGTLYRKGRMRLATAGDEILPLRDPRCRENEAYLVVILLSRVIARLESTAPTQQAIAVNTKVIEGLFRADLAYLQEVYNRINGVGCAAIPVQCPHCEHPFEVGLDSAGVIGYPLPALYEEVAFVSYHFHWNRDDVLALEHPERKRWVEEISAIHRRMNAESGGGTANLGMP